MSNAAVAAIEFALETDEGLIFLRYWNEGEFDTLRKEWPEAPESIYIGADPLLEMTDDFPINPDNIADKMIESGFTGVDLTATEIIERRKQHDAKLKAEIEKRKEEAGDEALFAAHEKFFRSLA